MKTATFLLILLLGISLTTALGITPLEWREKPHSLWQYRTVPTWNGGSLDEHLNLRVNSDQSGQIQNEEQACINPVNPDNFVAVWRDFRLGYRRVGIGYSLDGGQSWTDDLFPQMFYDWQSDPVLVVDDNGVFTANMISYVPGYGDNGLLQVSSYDGGVTWQDSVWATLITDDSGFEDKQMLTIDTSLISPYYGSFYCSWTHFHGSGGNFDSSHIWLTYKRPELPYSEPVVISSVRSNQWSNVTTGINGEVYVSWVSYRNDAISFARSTDGGETFTQERAIRSTGFQGGSIDPDLLIFSYGAMAVDHSNGPYRGRLYMVFTDAPELGDTDVFLMYSDDHGVNWSTPAILHDDDEVFPVDQFHPWLSVDEEGRVWVAFYDRRNDPNGLLMDVYFTVSEDGGQSWRVNERITDVSSDPGAGSLDAGLIGEYIGWCARGGKALAVWTDTRLGNQDVYAAVIDSVFPESATDGNFILHPSSLTLSAFPNPTNSSATLKYTLPSPSSPRIRLYNTLGQTVRAINPGRQSPGEHTHHLDLSGLVTSLYIAEISAGPHSTRSKLLLLR